MGREIKQSFSDEDSYGPTPPPPNHPHPDDSRTGKSGGVQIQGIDDVLKDDPPEANGGKPGGDMNDDLDEDLSVEIPPTKVVQRMQAREAAAPLFAKDNGRWMTIVTIVCCLLVIVAIVLGAGFGTGAFKKDSSEQTGDGATQPPQDLSRAASLASYLGTVNAGGLEAFTSPDSPESLALNWLINDDPLQLGTATPEDRFRLEQRYALLTVWFSSPSAWTIEEGWLQDEDECDWYGVTCDPVDDDDATEGQNAVTALELNANNLQLLPADISMLGRMTVLSMSGNSISGLLPYTVQGMTALEVLDVSNNRMSDDLSNYDWSNLTNLKTLRIGGNNFTGQLHESLWTLTQLEELRANNNNLGSTVSDEVANMVNLAVFDISNNRRNGQGGYTGSLPLVFLRLPNLEVLSLGGNGFSGQVPPEYATFANVKELELQANVLTGAVPADLASLPLTALRLGGNSFDQGPIPDFLYNMVTLEELDLSFSNLQGPISDDIGNLVNLRELRLASNFLTGSEPAGIAALENLETLSLSNNFMTGGLDFVTGLSNLMFLDVSNNQFQGEFPDLSGLSSLEVIQTSANDFGSGFPESLTGIESLGMYTNEMQALAFISAGIF